VIRPRIVLLVLFAMTVAACTAAPQPPPWPAVVHVLVGAALVIAGAMALNQRLEIRGDARMSRTARRPLPSGCLTQRQVTAFGLLVSAVGLAYLVLTSQGGVVAATLASWILYVWIYTPLKPRTAWQTPVGAVAGAMPVLIGAAAARAPMSPTALSLFLILCLWQFPHAMAIAWLYRQQFTSANVKVATVIDPSGRTAGILAALGAAALIPVSLVPAMMSLVGWGYAAMALLLGMGYLAGAIRFLRDRSDRNARWLLRASLAYLPSLCAALLYCRFLGS
jgi:protoheme IX farnesyltransferase